MKLRVVWARIYRKSLGLLNRLTPLYVEVKYSIRSWFRATEHNLPGRLVVSLTSYPPRFQTLHLTVKSLLMQRMRANIVELWIADDDYQLLPANVRKLERDGLLIRCCEDLRSYKKIVPHLRESDQDWIVIADDDLYYWPTWLQELVETVELGKREVICSRCHKIEFTQPYIPSPYMKWVFDTDLARGDEIIFPTGVGGVLYPPGVFFEDVCNKDIFLKLCPTGDDIWLFWMAAINGSTFKRSGSNHRLILWPESQDCALFKKNAQLDDCNDRQISAMLTKYGWPFAGSEVRAIEKLTTRKEIGSFVE